MIRSLFPTDLTAILFPDGSLSNEAKIKDNIGREESKLSLLATLSGQWTYSRDIRRTLVWPKGIRFRGLASARTRSGYSVWEVDHLLIDELDRECCLSLLVKIVSVLEELGVEKVFLRISAESPLINVAREAGFVPYVTEILYGREKKEGAVKGDNVKPYCRYRRKDNNDDYRLYELYHAGIPVSIRKVEGMTFQEWQSTRDCWSGEDWIFEEGRKLTGWMRVKTDKNAGQMDIPSISEDSVKQIMECALKALDDCRYLFCLIPQFQINQIRFLRDQGFNELKRYSVSVRELTVRAHDPYLVPIGV